MSGPPRSARQHAEDSSPLARATAIYAFRRRRAEIFAEPDIFGEPAYDMLLDLYIAHHEGRQVTVSDACHASHVPWATALRNLKMLHGRGLIQRSMDHNDRRRCYVALEPRALSALNLLLS